MRIILICIQGKLVSTNRPLSDKSPPVGVAPVTVPMSTETLFAPGQREVQILHGGEQYRLRLTRNGKLILTK